jgi:hypothetical protein
MVPNNQPVVVTGDFYGIIDSINGVLLNDLVFITGMTRAITVGIPQTKRTPPIAEDVEVQQLDYCILAPMLLTRPDPISSVPPSNQFIWINGNFRILKYGGTYHI